MVSELDDDHLEMCLREASRLLVAHHAPAVLPEEEVKPMSCPTEGCRKGGCSTEPRTQGGPSPKQR